ncbi:glycerate kinase [Tumebacillus permanentifrigoris]|uniref:Glycerate kinase n=1 Tax=Tumebacillus permanentifrigoris TaxID=378543 RepID=A0A316DBD0_9BACL|nr:glycerate kinase [Tumebacillus permanentifrigoris]PWK14905.1 glycerate kinase [Tumebacillus permanentifrigoris]
MKKVVVAPDSFKGSLTARELCQAMRTGILRVFPDADVVMLPLADGGEGTMETLILATGGHSVQVEVTDPLGRPLKAHYGALGEFTARNGNNSDSSNGLAHTNPSLVVIELAQASGLPLLAPEERNPLVTTTYGTGELIRHALDAGHRNFLIGLGGSASNDGGAGLLEALGLRLLDAQGQPLPRGGGALARLQQLDASGLDPRLQESTFTIATDVQNPLTGPTGASAIFGPQKGATPEQVAQLDEALWHFANHLNHTTQHQNTTDKKDLHTHPGGGAAGGAGAGLLAFFPCEMRSGIEVMLEAGHFKQHLQDADLVLTGEGRLDAQTLSGKTIAGVCQAAATSQVPVIALCGSAILTGGEMDELGLQAAFSLVPGPCTLDEALQHAAVWATERTEQILRLLR